MEDADGEGKKTRNLYQCVKESEVNMVLCVYDKELVLVEELAT